MKRRKRKHGKTTRVAMSYIVDIAVLDLREMMSGSKLSIGAPSSQRRAPLILREASHQRT